jgi:hypothetical protein
MVSAIILDPEQIASVAAHLDQCRELGAESAVILCADQPEEEFEMKRLQEEMEIGDPPSSLPNPQIIYVGSVWVVGSALPIEAFYRAIRPPEGNGSDLQA